MAVRDEQLLGMVGREEWVAIRKGWLLEMGGYENRWL